MKLKDWQGNEYGPGDRVFYVNGDSGGNHWRAGTVVDIVETEPEQHHVNKYNGMKYKTSAKYMIYWQDDKPGTKVSKLTNLSKLMKL